MTLQTQSDMVGISFSMGICVEQSQARRAPNARRNGSNHPVAAGVSRFTVAMELLEVKVARRTSILAQGGGQFVMGILGKIQHQSKLHEVG